MKNLYKSVGYSCMYIRLILLFVHYGWKNIIFSMFLSFRNAAFAAFYALEYVHSYGKLFGARLAHLYIHICYYEGVFPFAPKKREQKK